MLILLVDLPHQLQVLRRLPAHRCTPVVAGPRQVDQLALALDAQLRMIRFYASALLLQTQSRCPVFFFIGYRVLSAS
jgi:hypothetical protein